MKSVSSEFMIFIILSMPFLKKNLFTIKSYCSLLSSFRGFPGGLVVKNLPAMQEIQVRSLGGEDPLEEEMATRSSILAWKIPQTEELGRPQSLVSQRVRHD